MTINYDTYLCLIKHIIDESNIIWTDIKSDGLIATVFYKQSKLFILYKIIFGEGNGDYNIKKLNNTADYDVAKQMFYDMNI